MKSSNPSKRIDELVPLSHDHHHALRLSLKIRTGFKKGIDPARIKKHTDWFYKSYLIPHFKIEEKYIFPILGQGSELIKRAITEHRKLERLFSATKEVEKNLVLIAERLESHIRFEERVLFNEIQKVATRPQLQEIYKVHNSTHFNEEFNEKWDDEFWR